jgi:arylsulfatase A-like enzyme
VLAQLTTQNTLDSTFVAVFMDHGMGEKGSLYEQGVRIALMVRYPSLLAAGTTVSTPVANIDLAPTILALASTSDASHDGRSLLLPADTSRTLFHEDGYDRSAIATDNARLVKLIEAPPARASCVSCSSCVVGGNSLSSYPGSSAAVQLYDLSADGSEQSNLASSSADAAILAALTATLSAHMDATSPTGGSIGPSPPSPPPDGCGAPAAPSVCTLTADQIRRACSCQYVWTTCAEQPSGMALHCE